MCGRYSLTSSQEAIARRFLLEFTEEQKKGIIPKANITPGSGILAVRDNADTGRRDADFLWWGLIPSWVKDPANSMSTGGWINARSETVAEKPAFRDAIRYRRCLFPADGYYEWQQRGGAKVPYFFQSTSPELLALAGIWEHWMSSDGSEILSCCILTTRANQECAPVHDRMPVMISPDNFDLWLDPDIQDVASVQHLMCPLSPGRLQLTPVEAPTADQASPPKALKELPSYYQQGDLFG